MRKLMPQRFLRPGIRNSSKWNAVPFSAQSFYVRALTLVDDFGRYDGRASVLWGECFAVWNEQNPANPITLNDVVEMLQQLAAAGLVSIYEAGDKKVLQIEQWQERVREGTKEKWPANPESCSNTRQPAATCSDLLPPSPSPSPSPLKLMPVKLPKLTNDECELAVRFERGLGDDWAKDAVKWAARIKKQRHKCERVIADVEDQIRNNTVKKTPAALAEDNWKRFA
jgi:hypothetical protein